MKIWAEYSNKTILPYNKYIVTSDTLNILLKERPEIKKININIIPPNYTNIKNIEHNPSLIKIEALEGSLIDIKAISNKILKNAKIVLSDNQIIPMDIKENEINTQFLVSNNIDFKIICIDTNDNHSIPIKYSNIKIDDLSPYIVINNPEDTLK